MRGKRGHLLYQGSALYNFDPGLWGD